MLAIKDIKKVVLDVVKDIWPNFVIEEEQGIFEGDFFVYEDEASKINWDKGVDEGKMIYVIRQPNEITMVVEKGSEYIEILSKVFQLR